MAKRRKARPAPSVELLPQFEATCRSVFENMREGVALCEMLFEDGQPRDFVYLRVNASYERLRGLGNVVGRKVSDVIPGFRDTSRDLFDMYARVVTTGKPEAFETFVAGPNVWFTVSAYSPAPGQFVTVLARADEHKKSDESRRLFRALIDRSNDGVEVVDSQTGRFLDVNEKGCLDLGYTREEFLALSVQDVDTAVDKATFSRIVAELRKSGAQILERVRRRKDGSTFPVEINVSYVRLDRDYLVTTVRDITRRKQAEADLHMQSAALNAAANAIVITDRQGTITWVNPAFTDLTGYSAEEAVGRNPGQLVKSGVHDEAFYKELWDTIVAGRVWHGEMTNRRKDGTRYPEGQTITPIRDALGEITHFVGIKRDLTEEKGLMAQYLQAQKMETVGHLAGGIAHDFNNLLGAIMVFGELAADGMTADDPRREDLDNVQDAVQRATMLTRRLLTFSRQQPAQPKVLDLSALVTDVLKILSGLIGEDIQITTQLEDNLVVRADEGQMEQVILNLAVNARDAMPMGGRLCIATTSARLDDESARTNGLELAGDYVVLAVSDTGTGMSREVQARVFEPFFTTKGARGTGLGLATVHAIVLQSGGHTAVRSELDKGTTFTIHLPRLPADALEPGSATVGAMAGGGSETILVAEDDSSVRVAVSTTLKRRGYHILAARTAEAALASAKEHGGKIDLVISDVVMPGISGHELVERLQKTRPDLKALLTSGYAGDALARHGADVARTPFLQKPFTSSALARKVRQVLGGGAPPTAG